MRLVFMGTPEFSVAPLRHLLRNDYNIVAVYTKPDTEAGRKRIPVISPVKKLAEEWGIPLVQPKNFRQPGVVEHLAELKPDIIIVSAYGQILPKAVLDIPPLKCLNVHPSLLPRHRGATPVASAILAGDEFTGTSIMILAPELDAGPVLLQGQVPVMDDDTTGSLSAKLAETSAQLLVEALPRWIRGEITPREQDHSKSTYLGMLKKQEGEIDWNRPSDELWRRVRAFQPWPGCYTTWKGKQLKIIEAVPIATEEEAAAGKVVTLAGDKAAFGVGAGDGVLGLVKVQIEGKKAMSSLDFLRGQREIIGAVLPS